jgi:hypothetical protein
MLVINIGTKNKLSEEWVTLETSDGPIRIKTKIVRDNFRMVIDAPKEVRIERSLESEGTKFI